MLLAICDLLYCLVMDHGHEELPRYNREQMELLKGLTVRVDHGGLYYLLSEEKSVSLRT